MLRVIKKSKLQLIFVILFLICGQAKAVRAQSCQPVAPDLAAWWMADGNPLESRNRNAGTFASGGYAVGQSGQSFSFAGSGGGFVVADAPSLNPTAQMTLETWVFPTSDTIGGNAMAIIANKETAATTQFQIGRRIDAAVCASGDNSIPTGNFAVFIGGLTGLPDHCGGWVNGGANLPLNTWSYVAMTYDGANLRAFVNGNLTNTIAATGTISTTTGAFRIGSRLNTTEVWDGRIDETAIYSRALSAAEIQKIFDAGASGKCKPTATVTPSGAVGWWTQDGTTNSIAGGNNPSAVNAVKFEIGKVGQAVRINTNGYIEIPHTAALAPANATLEAWAKPEGAGPNTDFAGNVLFSKAIHRFSGSQISLGMYWRASDNRFLFCVGRVGATIGSFVISANQFPPGQFYHVAATYDGATQRLYVNGNLEAQIALAGTIEYQSTVPWAIGSQFSAFRSIGFPRTWNGIIDEVSLYNRALTQNEISSIYNAGIAGKLKIHNTSGTTATVGDATITFPSVTNAGTTQQIPLDANLFPAPTLGTHTGLLYDLATSAAFTGNPTVCFNLPAFTVAQFTNLRVLHFTNGSWTNVTASSNNYPTLCTVPVSSFSPFAIANFVPLSATVSVSGRVLAPDGRGIRNAVVNLTAPNGTTRTARTSAFGYYRFDEIETGQTYVFSVSSKRFQFAPQVVTITEDLSELDFIAMSETQ